MQQFRGISTELSAPPPTKQAGWIALSEKKKHDKTNARKLTAAETSEREARPQEKHKKQISRPIYQISLSPAFRSPSRPSPPLSTTQSIPQPQKPRGSTLNATLQPAMQPNKKKSKQYLISSEDIDERKSQQQRLLRAAYLRGEPPGSEK